MHKHSTAESRGLVCAWPVCAQTSSIPAISQIHAVSPYIHRQAASGRFQHGDAAGCQLCSQRVQRSHLATPACLQPAAKEVACTVNVIQDCLLSYTIPTLTCVRIIKPLYRLAAGSTCPAARCPRRCAMRSCWLHSGTAWLAFPGNQFRSMTPAACATPLAPPAIPRLDTLHAAGATSMAEAAGTWANSHKLCSDASSRSIRQAKCVACKRCFDLQTSYTCRMLQRAAHVLV